MVGVEYLTIAEFAEQAGVSKQAIYKQVNNENSQISPYILRDGRRTLIKISALSALYGVDTTQSTVSTPEENPDTTQSTQEEGVGGEETTQETTYNEKENQPNKPSSTPDIQPISTDYIDFLKAQVAELKAEKAEVEHRLSATIQEKDNIINDQAKQLAQLAQQVAQIADKALVATSQQQYLTALEKGDKVETTKMETIPENDVSIDIPKKSFWSKFFGR